ncbi:putative membrane protein [Ancylobacter sp. 3268]|uniref:hypothetical protein n=1 Tax=Ancylobacter sp. 3268 TaxID=2817752 RepID=UPI00285E0071|nr:hypothetical protein [Ancylobacter sp. 3268]MDR6952752.1 putative membrane protein [Ancylobacter sp. 3268]
MSRFAHSTKIAAVALAGVALASALPTPSQARDHRNNGAAVAAGVVGGLIVGGLVAGAASNAYGGGYGGGYYAPPPPPPRAYGGPTYAYGSGYGYGYRPHRPRCWVETQTFYNRWGRPYYRDVEVCR